MELGRRDLQKKVSKAKASYASKVKSNRDQFINFDGLNIDDLKSKIQKGKNDKSKPIQFAFIPPKDERHEIGNITYPSQGNTVMKE